MRIDYWSRRRTIQCQRHRSGLDQCKPIKPLHRLSIQAAAMMSTVAEKILTKANYVKDTRHHKNCFPFVQDWLDRYMVRVASRQANDLLKLCDQDSPGLPPLLLTPPASLSPPSQPSLGSDSPPHPRGSSASPSPSLPATGASTP